MAIQTHWLVMEEQEIIRRIRQRYMNRKPLNLSAVKRDEPELVKAVYSTTPYWGWKGALADAGIDYSNIRVYVRDYAECKICGERSQSLTMHLLNYHGITPEEYREDYPGAEIQSESLREQRTGISFVERHPDYIEHWEPIYTPEYVLDRLHEYAQLGYWMEVTTIGTIDVSLPDVSRKYLGVDWDEAVRMIGFNPAEFRGLVRDEDFTLDDFRNWLAEREQKGLSCSHCTIMNEYDDRRRRPRIYVWALHRYGNWRQAMRAAGADFSKPAYGGHHYLWKDQVDEELKRMRDAGEDMSHGAVSLLPLGGQLVNQASYFYGSWTAALDAFQVPLNLRTRRVRYDTPKDVVEGIAYRIKNGFSLAPVEMYFGFRSDIPLFKRAFKFFGSWEKGVAKARGNTEHRQQAKDPHFPTKAKILAEMKRRRKAGQLLAQREVKYHETGKHLYVMSIGFFGSWQEGVRAAGIDPKEYHQWNLQPPGKYTNKQEVLDAIRQRSLKNQPLNARGLTHGDYQDVPLLYTARKLFGTWEDAVSVAGIDYSTVVRKKQDYSLMEQRTYNTYPIADDVIVEIRRREKEGWPLTHRALTHGEMQYRDNALLTAAIKFFDGDWDNALVAAGIDLDRIHPAWVRERKERNRQKREAAMRGDTTKKSLKAKN